MKKAYAIIISIIIATISTGCNGNDEKKKAVQEEPGITNPIFPRSSSPCLVFHNGKYYYCQSSYVKVALRCTEHIDDIRTATEHTIFYSGKDHLISAPRLYRYDNTWYIYYGSDDGDLSKRTIHLLQNSSEDPLKGEWIHKAILNTGIRYSVHPSFFEKDGELYLFWSGNDNKDDKKKVWSIYAAELKNPWTIKDNASRILTPEYEWECQWVTGNNNMDEVPTYLEEAPVPIWSADSSKVLLYFSASYTISPFYCEGMAFCDRCSSLTDPSSWTKLPEPVFLQNKEEKIFGAGHVSFLQYPGYDDLYFLYHAYNGDAFLDRTKRSPRIQKASWDENGIPVLGVPQSTDIPIPVPSWEKNLRNQ